MLTMCLVLTTSNAFQLRPAHASIIRPSSSSPSTSTTLHARKGNRGIQRPMSDNNAKRNRAQNDVLDGIDAPPSFPHSVDPADLPPGPISADPLAPLIRTIVRAADLRKASDIVALRVTQCTSLCDFVVIASGTSRPQNQAIAAAVADDVAEGYDGKRCLGRGVPEGTADSGWILLDYGEVMVHVMTPKSRLFYDMEGVWKERGGEYMDISDVLLDEAQDVEGIEDDGLSMKERLDVEKEADPFWS